MTPLRIIADNAADRATLTASRTAGALVVSNLQTDIKSNVWRGAGTTERVDAAWTTPEPIQAVIFPFCNWSPTALLRTRVTTEVAATNLVLYSEQFDNAVWTKNAGTVTPNVIVAPDGNTTGDRFLTTAADGFLSQMVAGGVAGKAFVMSVWLKSTANRNINLYAYNGTAVATSVGVTTAWQRLSVTGIAAASGNITILIGGGGSVPSGTELHVWGLQLEQGPVATSYYPTTGTAATRPIGYIDAWQAYAHDSGAQLSCPAPALRPRGWTAAQSASAYAFGGGSCARYWLPAEIQATGVAIDIFDLNNRQGAVEAARLILGPYWSPSRTISDAPWTMVDLSTHYRTDAGDMLTDAGTVHKKLPINFGRLLPADRAALVSILRSSRANPIFVSVFPGAADLELERDYTIYGKRSQDSEIAIQYAIAYSTTVELEEI